MVQFEGYDRRIKKIEKCMAEYGFSTLEDVQAYTLEKGVDVGAIVRSIQPIAFENAVWAYTLGAVSYTHLDVYKRQDERNARRNH